MTISNGLGEHALMSRSPDGTAGKDARIRLGMPPPGRRRRWGRLAIGSILILGLIALYVHWKAGSNSSTRPAVPPVMISAATATSGDIGVYVNALGTVTPLNTVSFSRRNSFWAFPLFQRVLGRHSRDAISKGRSRITSQAVFQNPTLAQ